MHCICVSAHSLMVLQHIFSKRLPFLNFKPLNASRGEAGNTTQKHTLRTRESGCSDKVGRMVGLGGELWGGGLLAGADRRIPGRLKEVFHKKMLPLCWGAAGCLVYLSTRLSGYTTAVSWQT